MLNRTAHKFAQKSYSQSGEDLIIKFICDNLIDKPKPVYMDIGAFHPFKYNNCHVLYEAGSSGINIEPNPEGIELFNKFRKRDINLNTGIGKENAFQKYYMMDMPELNTFLKKEAYKREKQIVGEKELPVMTFNSIVEQYLYGITPDIVSIDIEGLDEEIIKSINFEKYRPSVFCIETIEFLRNRTWRKNNNIKEFLINKGYIHH